MECFIFETFQHGIILTEISVDALDLVTQNAAAHLQKNVLLKIKHC